MKQKLHYLFTLVLLLAVSTAWAKDFTGGELYTLQEVQYGKFEARMKMAAASGTVSSMFLYQEGSEIADGLGAGWRSETGGHDARPCYFHYGLGVGG